MKMTILIAYNISLYVRIAFGHYNESHHDFQNVEFEFVRALITRDLMVDELSAESFDANFSKGTGLTLNMNIYSI